MPPSLHHWLVLTAFTLSVGVDEAVAARAPPVFPEVANLVIDNNVGWEPDRLREGELQGRRDPREYLALRHASLDEPERFDRIASGGVAVWDRSFIATAAEVCHPTLRSFLKRQRPDRLLIKIDGTVDATTVACLEQLAAPKLFIALCLDDGEYALSGSAPCDGDAALSTLVASAGLRGRVRGLAIGIGSRSSWQLLASLTRLETLAVNGPTLARDEVDAAAIAALCARRELIALDVLDPGHLGRRAPLPEDCALQRVVFRGETLPMSGPLRFDHPDDPPSRGRGCALRRALVWSIEPPLRAALEKRCPLLERIDEVDSAKESTASP